MSMIDRLLYAAKALRNGPTPEADLQLAPMIEFYAEADNYGLIPEPTPASKHIPKWFKDIKPQVADNSPNSRDPYGGVASTAKKCLPLLDAMCLGYVMPLCADVNIRTDHEKNLTIGKKGVAEMHSTAQLGGPHNSLTKFPAVKFVNPWFIKTPPGVSTLFLAPLNSDEKRFTCLSAIVDTDNYPGKINFPAIWHEKNYDGIVKSGTPLVVAIPFRRDTTNMDHLIRRITPAETFEYSKLRRMQNLRASVYSKELREPR